MGNNFYTKWIDSPGAGYTTFNMSSMDPVPSALDRAITYTKNPVIHCDGIVTYDPLTGILAWSSSLRIIFNRTDGKAIANVVSAGNVTLADNQFAYVDLSETDGATLSVSVASVTTNAASNFITYNRLVLGYRNTASDGYFPVYLRAQTAVPALTSASGVTVYWGKAKFQKITLAHDAAFTFSGGADGDRLVLAIDALTYTPSWPGDVRYGAEITSITLTASKRNYVGFLYDGDSGTYDVVSLAKGF